MYTTIDGAKKRAGTLFRMFEDGGLIFPLHRCQAAMAQAGGYADWHALLKELPKAPPKIGDRALFRQRLLKALPGPCRYAALAWVDGLPREPFGESGRPPFFIYDVAPYLMEAWGAYRRHQPIVRIGSGAGQRLRETLVLGRLMNMHDFTGPKLEPDTCKFVYQGTLAELFAKSVDHPRFSIEFSTLVEAGVFEWFPGKTSVDAGTLKLVPPEDVDLMDELADHHGSKVGQWFEHGDMAQAAITALWEGLASIGIHDGKRIAEAIVMQGAPGFLTESGPVLELLSQQAAAGELDTLARTVALFSAMHPKNGDFVKRSVPSKIGSQYFAGHLGINSRKLLAWDKSNPQWTDDLIAALRSATSFSRAVDDMREKIESLAA